MVKTITSRGKFVSKKEDTYKRTNYVFEINEELFDKLEDLKNKLEERLNLTDDQPLYCSWFGSKRVGDETDELMDNGMFLRFTKSSMEECPDLVKGNDYGITFDIKHYNMNNKHGISSCLKAVY